MSSSSYYVLGLSTFHFKLCRNTERDLVSNLNIGVSQRLIVTYGST
jgi:hypothetical protein